jgi:hypothetical protein
MLPLDPTTEPPSTPVPGLRDHRPGKTVVNDVTLAFTGEVAIVLRSVVAFPDGVECHLEVRARQEIDNLVNGDAFPTIHSRWPPRPPGAGFILVGVRFGNGATARNWGPSEGAAIVLAGGGGSPRMSKLNFYIFPLVSDGPMEVWVEWPGAGIEATRTLLDGSAIRRSGMSVERLWK